MSIWFQPRSNHECKKIDILDMGAREEEAGVGGRLKFNLYQYAKQTSALTAKPVPYAEVDE
jgi:hypothetical protein